MLSSFCTDKRLGTFFQFGMPEKLCPASFLMPREIVQPLFEHQPCVVPE